jgi:hypothetical protein
VEDVIAAAGFFTALIVGLFAFSPIGRAIAAKISRSGPAAPGPEVLAQLDGMDERLEALQQQVGELAERQDFTERLLAQARERGLLGSGGAS